jgi:hypothetical protein
LLATLYAFVLEQRRPRGSPTRLLLAATFAQLTLWASWPVIFPLVAYELGRRFLSAETRWATLKSCWWYVVLSLLLLGYLHLQLKNPSLAWQTSGVRRDFVWFSFCIVSPFAWLEVLGPWGLALGAVVLGGFTLAGAAAVLADRWELGTSRWALLAALLLALYVPLSRLGQPRMMLIFSTVFVVFAGLGLRQWTGSRGCRAVVAAWLLFVAGSHLLRPLDPYAKLFTTDTSYSTIAWKLQEELRPEDVWLAYPYYLADCLYPYARLAEPLLPQSAEELELIVTRRPGGARVFALLRLNDAPQMAPYAARAERRWDFMNSFHLLQFGPAPGESTQTPADRSARGRPMPGGTTLVDTDRSERPAGPFAIHPLTRNEEAR